MFIWCVYVCVEAGGGDVVGGSDGVGIGGNDGTRYKLCCEKQFVLKWKF